MKHVGHQRGPPGRGVSGPRPRGRAVDRAGLRARRGPGAWAGAGSAGAGPRTAWGRVRAWISGPKTWIPGLGGVLGSDGGVAGPYRGRSMGDLEARPGSRSPLRSIVRIVTLCFLSRAGWCPPAYPGLRLRREQKDKIIKVSRVSGSRADFVGEGGSACPCGQEKVHQPGLEPET